jgi:hypothetical protein
MIPSGIWIYVMNMDPLNLDSDCVQGQEPERGGAGGEAQETAAQAAQEDPGEQDAQQGHEEPHPHRPGQAPSVQGCASGFTLI